MPFHDGAKANAHPRSAQVHAPRKANSYDIKSSLKKSHIPPVGLYPVAGNSGLPTIPKSPSNAATKARYFKVMRLFGTYGLGTLSKAPAILMVLLETG